MTAGGVPHYIYVCPIIAAGVHKYQANISVVLRGLPVNPCHKRQETEIIF